MSCISILKRSNRTAAAALVVIGRLKTSILTLALGIALAGPVDAYASEPSYGPALSHRTPDYWSFPDLFAAPTAGAAEARAHAVWNPWRDPFKPRETDGLSRDPDACASYGCVDNSGG